MTASLSMRLLEERQVHAARSWVSAYRRQGEAYAGRHPTRRVSSTPVGSAVCYLRL